MQKEVGSIFPVSRYETELNEKKFDCKGIYFFSLCREALLYIARNCMGKRKVVLIPAYTCQTVIAPFIQEGWEIHFFPIDSKLCMKVPEFLSLLERVNPGVVLFHPYYGKKLLEHEINLLKQAKQQGALIVQDLTQSIFSQKKQDYIDITVGSLRKWLGIPDGGFLLCSDTVSLNIVKIEQDNEAFIIPQLDAMYLRGEYFRTDNLNYKKISIRLNKYAEGLSVNGPIVFHKMSDYSINTLANADIEQIRKKRIENFSTLFYSIKKCKKCTTIIDSVDELDNAPLYFPVYVENRKKFQSLLASKNIYAPILWEVEDKRVLIDETVGYIYEHLLAIPIDQRYGQDDMVRIADIINAICGSAE